VSDVAEAKLVLRVPDRPPVEFQCGEAPLTIGREAECEVHVDSRYVSRRHARIELHGSDFLLVELGSPNSIFVNGERVEGHRVLASGDTIRIADVTLDFQRSGSDGDRTEVFAVPVEVEPKPVQADLNPTEERRVRQLFGLRGTLTIMFTDLEGSTQITQALGDTRAQEYLRTHNALLREQFAAHEGLEVKGQGDGFMVVFTSGRAATRCAIAIQRKLAIHNIDHASLPIRVRIGMNLGEVISEEDDFFGTAVILAARVASRARGGEIFVSEVMHDVLGVTGEFQLAQRGNLRLKGFTRSQRVYAVEWEERAPGTPQ
jgi:class 3 adenylate cyclase